MCVSLCVFLPGEYQSLWRGSPLCPLWEWLSFLFAASRSAPHPPPFSHQKHTGKREKSTISHSNSGHLSINTHEYKHHQDWPEGSAGRWPYDWCSLQSGCEGGPGGGPKSPSSPPPPRFCGCSGRRCWWGGIGSDLWSTGRSHQTSSCRRAGKGEERRDRREWIPTRGKSLKEEDHEQVQK